MEAVILATGEGTRLRALTEDEPKGMVMVDSNQSHALFRTTRRSGCRSARRHGYI